MNWKTILIAVIALVLWLTLVVSINPDKQDTSDAEKLTAESDKQPNIKSLAEIKEEIQFIVQDSIEEEIQKEVEKGMEQSANSNGSSE